MNQIVPAKRTYTVSTIANLTDTDGIKTAIASATTEQVYTSFNGTPGGTLTYARTPTATLSSNAGSYVNNSTVTFVGTCNGIAVTSVATISGTDGGITVEGNLPLTNVTSITVQAQVNTGGAFTFGFTDLWAGYKVNGQMEFFRAIQCVGADGSLKIEFGEGLSDTLVLLNGQEKPVMFRKLDVSGCTTGACVSWLFSLWLISHQRKR